VTKDIDALLDAREKRRKHALDLTLDMERPVVIAKANTPGFNKNTPESNVILNTSSALIGALFEIEHDARVKSVDGDYHIFVVASDALYIKRLSVYLENTHTLGRLMDLDVYTEGSSVTRTALNFPKRSCFLCGRHPAFCARENTHTPNDFKTFITSKVRSFLLDALSNEAELALLKELYLTPCFSLVGPEGSGIHSDMNITHFLASIDALKPYFKHYLAMGMDLEHTYPFLRLVGLKGEKAMFKATGDINTHKGTHFIFALALPVFMDSVLNQTSFDSFKDALRDLSKLLIGKDYPSLKTPKTTGEHFYRDKGIEGIRGEALRGFQGVFDWYPKKGESGFQKLLRIMARIEDTTLLKRGIDLKTMKKALMSCEEKGFKAIDDIKHVYGNTSPGGAADLMALVFFLEHTDHLLK